MARKGRETLVEAPPAAASSSEEDESSSDDEELPVQKEQVSEKLPSSSEDEEEDDDDEEQEQEQEDEDDDDAEEEEEQENLTRNLPSPPPKALIQKKPESPMAAPLAKATVLASPALVSKRKGSVDEKVTPKKAKVEATGDDTKKPLFQRLWSDDDEIAILQGMIDYKAKKGTDPMADADGFLEFIKKSLHVVDVNKGQIVTKVRGLKRKLETAKKKKKISDLHGIKVFELSKRVWESDGVKNNGDVDSKDSNSKSRSVKKSEGSLGKLKGGGKNMNNGMTLEDAKKEEKGKDKLHNWEISKCEKKEIKLEELGSYDFLRDGVKLLGQDDKVEMEEKWKKQNAAELNVYLQKLDLIRELGQKILDAIESA